MPCCCDKDEYDPAEYDMICECKSVLYQLECVLSAAKGMLIVAVGFRQIQRS